MAVPGSFQSKVMPFPYGKRLPAFGGTNPPAKPSTPSLEKPTEDTFDAKPKKDSALAAAIQKEKERLLADIPERLKPLERVDSFHFEQKHRDIDLLGLRAEYNITKNRDVLNGLLPYRAALSASKDQEALKRYDQMVDKIMDKAEFYRTDSAHTFCQKIFAQYPNPIPFIPLITKVYKAIRNFFVKRLIFLSRGFRKFYMTHLTNRQRPRGQQTPDVQFKKTLKAETRPLKDDSTRYLVAAGIAELLHQRPQYLDKVLNNPKHPLRFVLSNLGYQGMGAQDMMGANMVWVCKPIAWATGLAQKSILSQHEFIHLLSEGSDMDVLPTMSKAQQARLRQLRAEMEAIYKKNDHGLTSMMKLGEKTSTGLIYYAFKDDIEFLAVSIDAFKQNPKDLCKTKPGQKLYDLYKEHFGIDPLKELPSETPDNVEKNNKPETPKAD